MFTICTVRRPKSAGKSSKKNHQRRYGLLFSFLASLILGAFVSTSMPGVAWSEAVAYGGNGSFDSAVGSSLLLNINKASASITFDKLRHPYEARAKAARVSTRPGRPNVTLNYSHDGQSVTAPATSAVHDLNYAGGTIASHVINWNAPANIIKGTPLGAEIGTIEVGSPTYAVSEDGKRVLLTLNRSGNTAAAVTLSYALGRESQMSNCNVMTGTSSAGCEKAAIGGTLQFASGQTVLSLSVPLIDGASTEDPDTLTVTVAAP